MVKYISKGKRQLLCHWLISLCFALIAYPAMGQLDGSQPIPCNGPAYLSKGSGTNYSLYSVDLNTGFETLYAGNFISLTNAIGYNITDGYIWGVSDVTNRIYRIGAGGNVDTFNIPPLAAGTSMNLTGNLVTGDVGPDGIYYVYPSGASFYYRIDLNPASPTYLQRLSNINLSGSAATLPILDWVVSQVDGQLYAYGGGNRTVYKINPVTGVVSTYSITASTLPPTGNYGATYFDNAGNLYVSYNNNGDIYRISDPGAGNNMILFSTGGVSAVNNDGARCTGACVKPRAGTDKVIAGTQTSVTMDALPTNTAVWTQLPGNPAPVTIANTGSATTSVSGFSAYGTYLFVWTVLGGCSDTVSVTYGPVMPVKLISIDAAVSDCAAKVSWTVAMEFNVAKYELETADLSGGDLKTAYRISGIPNSGNTKTYDALLQVTPGRGMLLRLKTTDTDGSVAYSKYLLLRCNDLQQVSVIPDPASGNIIVKMGRNLQGGPVIISIVGMDGKTIVQKKINSSGPAEMINTESVPAGVYVVRVDAREIQVNKLITIMK